ncbi:DUF6382 domain-containing protein [Paenibacillus sp. S-12]|uniref:DUF6382 domain-containing protein n=1 Tax=Paenibacillus sp. S-12 TaxID=3031371 RepID=UPI0025A00F5A|nr:DUF6382 domain-containing protein [Paenibacillus sp. S-12]
MYGYKADFVHEGKMRMLLTREPTVHSDELDAYQINMLRFNEVPHLLPVEIREVDFEASFLYDISGKKMMEQVLRSLQITAIQYFEWMFQLVNVLEGCRAYMLHPNQILLHERFIYVDGSSWNGNLYTAYIPTVEPLHPQAGMEGLRRLGILLSSHVNAWDGDGFQRLVQLLSQEGATLADVRGLLQSLIVGSASGRSVNNRQLTEGQLNSGDGGRGGRDNQNQLPNEYTGAGTELGRDEWNSAAFPSFDRQDRVPSAFGQSKSNVSSSQQERGHCTIPDEAGQEYEQSNKKYTIVTSGVVITVAALGWKFGYMSNPTPEVFTYTIAWNIAIVAIGAMYLTGIPSRWWKKLYSHKAGYQKATDEQKFQPRANQDWNNPNRLPEFLSMELSHISQPMGAMDTHNSKEKGSSQLEQNTVLSSSPSASELAGHQTNERSTAHTASASSEVLSFLQQQRAGEMPQMSHVGVNHFHSEQRSIVGGDQGSLAADGNDYYASLTHHTAILDASDSDATVMLGEGQAEGSPREPYLQQLDEAGMAIIGTYSLHVFPFIIGRADQGVHHRDESMGVSKHHCEFIRTPTGSLELRDLGSKNGTELQGELLIPYKLYSLNDGDKLSIARSKYIFRVG